MESMIHLDLTDNVILSAGGVSAASVSIPVNCKARFQVNPKNSHLECFINTADLSRESELKALQQSVVSALSRDYRNVYLINLEKDDLSIIKLDGYLTQGLDFSPEKRFPYTRSCAHYVRDRVYPDDQQMMLKVLSRENVSAHLKDSDEYIGTYRILANGTVHYCQYKFVREQGSTEVVAGFQNVDAVVADERKRQEEMDVLVEQEAFRRKVFSSLVQIYFCVFYVDMATGKFRELSQTHVDAIKTYIGQEGDAREKFRTMCDLLVAKDQVAEIAEFTNLDTLSDRLKDRDYIDLRFYGTYVGWCEGLFVPVERDDQGNSTKVLWVLRSIKEEVAKEEAYKERLREALQKAEQASVAKSNFLTRMSHDIRTPLNGIIGILDLMDKKDLDLIARREYHGKAKVAANHLLALLNDILEMSKLEDTEAPLVEEPFNLQQILGEIYTIANLRADENSVKVSHDDAQNLRYLDLVGCPLYIRQVFLNILTNAIKYNKVGGSVHCYSEQEDDSLDTVTYRFHVIDSGVGIKPEFLEHIFEPFSQERDDARSKFQGTGMGMAIVKRLVEKMHGQISVESEVGKGSHFTVTLTFKIDLNPKKSDISETVNVPLNGMNVLLVEDNELNMEIAKGILEDMDVSVICARDGMEAVRIFEQKPVGSIDLILMDLMMPVLDGYGATKKIRLSHKKDGTQIPIVALSANAFAEDVQKSKAAGMNGHLAKPINISQLKEVLAKYRR